MRRRLVLLLSLMAAFAPQADAAEVPAVAVTPATVALAPGHAVDVLVLLSNPTADTLTRASVTALPALGAELFIQDTKPGIRVEVPNLAPHQQITVSAKVQRGLERVPPGGLVIRFDYTAATLRTVAITTVTIADVTRPALEPPVDVTTETALDDVDEKRAGPVYLVIRNREQVPVAICAIAVTEPSGVEVTPERKGTCSAPVATVPAGDALTLKYAVEIRGQVSPGKALVLFDVQVSWAATETHVVESVAFSTSVFGESALLAAVEIPTFLLLPGFLLLVAFRMVGTLANANLDRPSFPWHTIKSAEFALVAVTLSIVAAPVYDAITGRSYLVGRSLRDVLYVWVGSIATGAACGGVASAGVLRYRSRLARRIPHTGMQPIALLDYLAANDKPVKGVSQVRFADVTSEVAFVVHGVATGKFWAAPQIVAKVNDGHPNAVDDITTALEGPATALAALLHQLLAQGAVSLEYAALTHLTEPTEFTAGTAGAPQLTNQKMPVIQVDEGT